MSAGDKIGLLFSLAYGVIYPIGLFIYFGIL
jgi:hypothetical protein